MNEGIAGKAFHGVVDFDKALANPANPAFLLPQLAENPIRPNDAAMKATASTVDLKLLSPR